MYFPRTPRVPSFANGARSQSSPTERVVLGVGSRVIVVCRNSGSEAVALTDDGGTKEVATIAGGVEVEILAWRPRRNGETRYRVVSTPGGVEGWLGATSLRQRPAPLPAKRLEVADRKRPPAPGNVKPVTKSSGRETTATRRIAKETR